jgi:hypothetical protein
MVLEGFFKAVKKYIYRVVLAFSNYRLRVRYTITNGEVEPGVMGRVKLLAGLIGCDALFGENPISECVVKPSKLIISNRDSGVSLFVFDRPASEDYWKMREQWSECHNAPSYLRIDERAFYQISFSNMGSLLSLTHADLCKFLSNYLHKQIDLQNLYGVEVPASKFLEKPYKLISDMRHFVRLPGSLDDRVESMLSIGKRCIGVPSVIEPWPIISHAGLVFTDLSPVEFRQAPLLHDLCYMLMKYEMYGARHETHKPFLPLLFGEVRESSIEKSETVHLAGLVEQIKAVVTFEELMDSYVLMVMFHCYVKYHATGRFTQASQEARLVTAIRRHVSVFNSIGSYAIR